eukprot:CAMPEP_0194335272 /NCGR_PEP_ID=MMETSP0171-20130528/68963_1 /TAXON_ID=218684 /ORGANISM="Corethron pennatum, Strain L29A3" /LENGTH=143 /DNA_ID=CAMNT_0039098267 /DNA_START=116 /DNA_END=549 /DNA_ORIENTATION=-
MTGGDNGNGFGPAGGRGGQARIPTTRAGNGAAAAPAVSVGTPVHPVGRIPSVTLPLHITPSPYDAPEAPPGCDPPGIVAIQAIVAVPALLILRPVGGDGALEDELLQRQIRLRFPVGTVVPHLLLLLTSLLAVLVPVFAAQQV